MSRELILYPDARWASRTPVDTVFPLTRLHVAPDPRFLDALETLQAASGHLSENALLLFTEDGLETVTADAYDEPLTWLEARHFAGITSRDWEPWNLAVLAFMREAEPKLRVYLYWE